MKTIFLSVAVLLEVVEFSASLTVSPYSKSRSVLALSNTKFYKTPAGFNSFSRYNSSNSHLSSYKTVPGDSFKQNSSGRDLFFKCLEAFTIFTPVWTLLVSIIGIIHHKAVVSLVGDLNTVQTCLWMLMLSMGLSIEPDDVSEALKKPQILLANLALCFVMMPLISVIIAKILRYDFNQTSGIILLGSVSGGQASNLFTMIAGGDVALSILCTLTSTLAGVFITPFLINGLLGTTLSFNLLDVLADISSLVLVPVMSGLFLGFFAKGFISRIRFLCPIIGIFSTLILCAGGAAKSAIISSGYDLTSILSSCILSSLGGLMAFLFTSIRPINQKVSIKSKKALVIETLSKSPTLAYVLASKHFEAAAAIPSAAMVTLAAIGALVGSGWSLREKK